MLHRRRFLTTASSGLALGAVALLLVGRDVWAQPSYTVPLAQLQEMAAQRFPRSVPVQGLLDLTLQAPALRCGKGLQPNPLQGLPALTAFCRHGGCGGHHQVQRRIHPDELPAPTAGHEGGAWRLARHHPPQLAVVQSRGRAARALGLQPGPITVTAEGLTVAFVGKAPG